MQYTLHVLIYVSDSTISAVKISALMQAIRFFQFNALKLFNAVNAGQV